MDNEQPSTNQERAPSEIPCDNLNTSCCNFSDTTSNNPSSYDDSFASRRRRNQRRLRHEITINITQTIYLQINFLMDPLSPKE
ncbi:hypothetical protein RhiirA4_460721 [Rhizophagus irregularis]|uniref:Uncharacterized protein n=1 Tax=Rhizophagus irregularis TaxID=588596 RepID=A0A2I1GH65_9GLOM|nr:hypothetical protein RhiirA4_460721 [Rhizophagus irregularis]